MTDEDDFIHFLGSPRPPKTPEQQAAHVAAVRRAVERMKARIAASVPAEDVTVGKAGDYGLDEGDAPEGPSRREQLLPMPDTIKA